MARTGSAYRAVQGLNRAATAAKVATSAFSQSSTPVGDIAQGTVVEVELDGGTPSGATVEVAKRATIALFGGHDAAPPATTGNYYWTISESKGVSTLTVSGPNGSVDTIKFWVF